jgi:rod shape-determining protein MreB
VEGPSVCGLTPALERGVIVNPDAATRVLRALLKRAQRFGPWRPRVITCVPTDVTPSERAALVRSLRQAGAAAIAVTPEPLAAAIGAGLDVSAPHAQLVIDIGHGITDCAVIRAGQVVATRAVRRACADLYDAVRAAVWARYQLRLLPREAERLVANVNLAAGAAPGRLEALARCELGYLRRVAIPTSEVAEVLEPALAAMLAAPRALLRDLPAELGAEIIERGILLSGGGALWRGMSARLAAETGIAVRCARDPLHAVIRGARAILPTVVEHHLWQH